MKIAFRTAWLLFCVLGAAAAVFYFNPLWVGDQQVRFRLWRAGVQSRFIEVDGHRIHYLEAGSGPTSQTLVLIHGLGARSEDWAALIPSFSHAGFHVYAPDLLGYGRSDKPDVTFSIALEEKTVTDFMHTAGLAHADVDGWSMGGWIAAKLALDHPELVNRLVLDDSAGLRFQPDFSPDLFVPHDEAGLRRLLEFLSPHPPAMPHFVARAALRKLQRNGRVVQGSMDSMESGADLLDDRLRDVAQPTLIVWGSEDRLLPIAIGQTMHSDIANSVLATITGCGHLAPSECYQPVAAATIQFLKAQPPMPRGEETFSGPLPQRSPQSSH